MTLDPTKIQIESHHAPIWEREESFQDVMAEQLRHAPWLLVSILAHVAAAFLLYFVIGEQSLPKEEKIVTMEKVEEEEIIEEEEEEVEEPEEVEVVEETFEETEVVEDEVVDEVTEDVNDSVESAFDSNQWNTAVGLGGGAAGGFKGGRGGRKGGRKKLKKNTARAIDLGLKWLKDHQDDDGKWDADNFMKHDEGAPCDGAGHAVHDVGVTGLALLAFLGDGSTMKSGEYKQQVKDSVMWLREQQDPDTGLFGTSASHDFIYNHAIAAYAMCEAQGLSRSSILKKTAQRGINYLESHRNPYAAWRYQPRDDDNDVSVTGWCVMAYKSGKDFKLQVSDSALESVAAYLDEVTDPGNGHAGYTKRGEGSSRKTGDHGVRFPIDKGEAMTAVALFTRFFLKQDPKETPVMELAANTILAKPPVNADDGSIDHYYWYYATYALFQMGGKHWTEWQKHLLPAVVKTQQPEGNEKGSWDPNGAWGDDGGRVYATAIQVLTLEAYYRYDRLIR